MNNVIVGKLKYVVNQIKQLFVEDSVSKSRNVRGRISSIVEDLRLANEQIDLERKAGGDKHFSELQDLKSKIAKLEEKIASQNKKFDSTVDIHINEVRLLNDESAANYALARGIEKLIKG